MKAKADVVTSTSKEMQSSWTAMAVKTYKRSERKIGVGGLTPRKSF